MSSYCNGSDCNRPLNRFQQSQLAVKDKRRLDKLPNLE
jgi:hypothetical protein